jgi:transposase
MTSVPVEQIARKFGISRSTIYNWRSRRQHSDSVERSTKRGGRPAKTDREALEQLRLLMQASGEHTLRHLCAELERATGVRVHRSTMSRMLRRLGLRLPRVRFPQPIPASPTRHEEGFLKS